ncbi:FG-GAP-like repeat-containing protein [Dyadobacter psychrophilus]|uniref:Repeat domain-containing protein n=1 Tax=Dyadobacter psychrophilus TaxID=651661 RepID=A0A1T5C6T0_9BACT|nr:FG-GAP-like repeat-containing protein [Dyadobacter psychrophilus]SKB55086.1 Repeat domain-containing protein [Dyadobacter psychrophilus]
MKNSRIILLITIFFASCQNKDTLFSLLKSNETGIEFNNFIDEDAENNVLAYGYFYNGGGVAAADFNNDGLVDLYFTGNMVANKLYLNKGDLEFEDISEKSGTGLNEGWKTGVSLVDINDDGWIDIFVSRAGAENPRLRSKLLYVNNGKTADGIPTFTEKSAQYGLDDQSYTTQAVFFDYDRDGDTDCFLLNHSVQKYAGFSNLIGSYREQRNEAYGNKLLRNDGGRFSNVTDSSGIVSNVLSFGLGVNISDFNNDGWQDIYIANDYNENDYLYLNQKDGKFKEVIREATGHVSLYSMGTDAADINNDGLMDIMTLDMLPASNERIKLTSGDDNYDKYQQLVRAGFHDQTSRNMLQLNNGVNANGVPVFSEIGQLAGVSNTDWSWAALMGDFDNDGWKDIFVSNGYARDYTNMEFLKYSTDAQVKASQSGKMPTQMEIIAQMPPIDEPDYIFQNQKGLTFAKKIKEWGFEKTNQSNGAIYADLDNDGDLDIVTNNVNQKAFVYRNNAETKIKSNYLKVKLESPKYAFTAGTKLTLFSDSLTQTQNFMPVRGFQSAQWDHVHFGLGTDSKIDSLVVTWADGSEQVVKNPVVNKSLVVKYSDAKKLQGRQLAKPFTYWKPVTGPDFTHLEDARNDFRIQTLLPNMLSYQGPKMAQKDINGDGTDDFYIAGARGQAGSLFISQNGKWVRSVQPEFEGDAAYEDADAAFLDADGDGDQDLLIVSAGYELNPEDPLLIPRLYINANGRYRRTSFPKLAGNAGTIAVSDLDKDGDLDVFLGVRVTPGRFPESAGGLLFTNDGKGNFTDQTVQLAPKLAKIGMVTDAVFEDLNKDGYPELILTADWNPIRVFGNNRGKLSDASATYGTAALNGCWNTIKSADLDGDGDLDFVVGNMGVNWQWNLTSPDSLALYAADYDNLQRIVPVIGVTENGVEMPYASRDELLDQIPSLKKKYTDYVSYSKAKLSEILPGEKLKNAQKLSAKIFKSGILENRNGKFIFHPLPVEAQFAPVYAISLFDMDANGKSDIVLGGNLKQTRVRVGKSDANLIQVFLNRGNFGFEYVPQAKSGFFTTGEVRDLAIVTIGHETQLLAAMNNAKLVTYRLTNPAPSK